MSDEKLAAAFGRFVGLVHTRALGGLAHPEPRGMEAALRDIARAAEELLDQLDADQLDCAECSYRALDADDLAEHERLNHAESRALTVREMEHLSSLARCVRTGRPITRVNAEGQTEWGIARGFTHEGGGFLTGNDDVRNGFVWISAGSSLMERWWPVSELLTGLLEGTVALNYRGDS